MLGKYRDTTLQSLLLLNEPWASHTQLSPARAIISSELALQPQYSSEHSWFVEVLIHSRTSARHHSRIAIAVFTAPGQDNMRILLVSTLVLFSSLTSSRSAESSSQCPTGSLPVRVRGETVSECSTTSSERQQAIQSLNSRVDSEIEALLPRIEDFLTPSPCSGPGWKRIVYIDMKNSSHSCPPNSGWTEMDYNGKRLCRRNSPTNTCEKATFDVDDIIGKYNKVCGRVVAYKLGDTEGFGNGFSDGIQLVGDYVDGVSITHGGNGAPLEHIWTFAAGSVSTLPQFQCPCEGTGSLSFIPTYIPRDRFFCESGGRDPPSNELLSENPLWDGAGCDPDSSCCSFNDPPYFVATLNNATCDSIDVRLCASDSDEGTPIELIELYVK